jgi:hypothetical protein
MCANSVLKLCTFAVACTGSTSKLGEFQYILSHDFNGGKAACQSDPIINHS